MSEQNKEEQPMRDRPRTLLVYRKAEDGKLIPIEIRFDSDHMLISMEEQDTVQESHYKRARERMRIASDNQAQNLIIKNNSQAKVIRPSEEDRTIMPFFSMETPCWFDGCEDLREEYKSRLEDMGGVACKNCDKGRLNKEFITRVKRSLKEQKAL